MQYFCQQRLLPALVTDMADVITGSEFLKKKFAERHSLTATTINDPIKNILQNPQFKADKVDSEILQRLSAAMDRGDLKIVSMRV